MDDEPRHKAATLRFERLANPLYADGAKPVLVRCDWREPIRTNGMIPLKLAAKARNPVVARVGAAQLADGRGRRNMEDGATGILGRAMWQPLFIVFRPGDWPGHQKSMEHGDQNWHVRARDVWLTAGAGCQ